LIEYRIDVWKFFASISKQVEQKTNNKEIILSTISHSNRENKSRAADGKKNE
jgi:hypothetical protein